MCASLNHRRKIKAEPIWQTPRKLTESSQLNTFTPGLNQSVHANTAQSSKDSASLVVCTRKNFWFGGADFL